MSAGLGSRTTVEARVRLTTQALYWTVSLVLVAVVAASAASLAARSSARGEILDRLVSLSCEWHLAPGAVEGTTVGEETGYIALFGYSEAEVRPLLERCAA